MSEPDPIESLAVGVAADHAEKKRTRAKKPPAAKAGDEAASEALDAGSPPDEAEALGTVVEEKVEEVTGDGTGTALPAVDDANAEREASAADAPASPGDDAESVFDRRLSRLMTIVEEAEFESGTVFGDLRDTVLDLFKHRPKVWSAMSAGEQQDAIRAVEAAVKRLLGRVVLVIAQEESDTITGTLLGQFAVKGETIEAKLKIEHADSDILVDLYGMAGHKIVLVSADDKRFMSARRDAPVQPDQLAMGFADKPREAASSPPPPPPADDSDLNPDDDEEEVDPTSADDWGVFNTTRGDWLVEKPDGDEGDEWSANSGEAIRMPHDEAKEFVAGYDADGDEIVVRQLGDDPGPAEPLNGGEDRTHGPESAVDD